MLLPLFKDYISVIRKNELENHIDESIWVKIQGKGTTFLLCSTYRPEWTDADYWTRLNHAIGMGYQINQNIILTGDLNSDLFTSHNNKLIDTMNLFNLTNVIEKPTRVTEHSSTLLDPIIISDSIHYSFSDVLKVPSDISDHDASIIFIECPKFQTRSFQREVWLYERTDNEKIASKLDTVDWNALLSDSQDVDEMCNTFTETFLRVARECIPTKIVTIRNNDRPWFNSELRREIRKRDRIRKTVKKYSKQSDIDKYKKQRNRVNNLKKIAKEHFEQNLDNINLENISNPKTYWKIMKMLIKSNKECSNIPPLQNIIQDEGLEEIVYGDDEKCELLNKYFSFISSLEDANVPLPDIELKTDNFLRDIVITTEEIVDIIKIINPNKASGPDIISHKMLKICPEKIAAPLQIIFNKSLLQCKYPTSWKIAHVIAIFIKGDKSLPSNYRPISLISCVGKIMERVIYKYVFNHLQRNKLIYEYQSGFLPKYSTVHQLLEMYNCILNSLEKKEISCFVFCDFSKAFDKVWHKGLIHKIKSYGVDSNLLNWFSSYLQDRQQRVLINKSSSSLCNVSAGVPQGSVLGPLLFIMYINDIAEKLISLTRLFADDTSFSYSNRDELQIKTVIAHDLKELDEWSKKWLMTFNSDKTEIMLFSNTDIPEFNFTFNERTIPITNSHKHLGVTFSSDAKWNIHVENILLSIYKHLNVLRKLKYKLSRKNLEKLYLVYIRPIFEYACEVWDNYGVGNSNKLDHLQLEAARIVTGLPIFASSLICDLSVF